MSDYENNMSI